MHNQNSIGYYFIIMASVVIVLAGIKSAASILVPFLLSLFIAIILSPFYTFITKKRVPSSLALLIVISLFVFLILLVVKLIGTSVTDFSANIDTYTQKLSLQYNALSTYAAGLGIDIPLNALQELFNTKRIMTLSSTILQSLGSLFTNGFVIILTVIFMLLESTHFATKIDIADGEKDTMDHIDVIAANIKHYMVIKTLISLATGVIVWLGLLMIGTDYAFLWAVLAFLFNFIPNIGSIIAAVPAVIITLVQLGGVSALEVITLYVGVNVVMGSVIEPKVMGKGLGLSTLVVFLSMLFWGWLLGIVGMLLSIPLTIMAKIIFDSNANTKWISILLGSGDNLLLRAK